ncbi:MAG: hypothetical protein ACI4R9_05710 [Kiritimatiellia bacterium]
MKSEIKLFSDEIRIRERARRRREPLWSMFSFLLHLGLFAVIVFCTPVKELMSPEPKQQTMEIAADRIADMAETLTEARARELLRQIEDMQSVLHNMDVMKEELAKDYDTFAAQSAENVREEMDKLVAETAKQLQNSLDAQDAVKAAVRELVAIETKENLADNDVNQRLQEMADRLEREAIEKTNTAQANAVNALDKLQVRAEFAGYRKTAEAAEKFRDAQMEAGKLQDKAQTASVATAHALRPVAANEKFIAEAERKIAAAKEKLSSAEAAKTAADRQIAQETEAKKAAERQREKLRQEKKFAEAKEIQEVVHAHGVALEKAKHASRTAQHQLNEAKHTMGYYAPRLPEALKRRAELEKIREGQATAKQLDALESAKKVQAELNARLEFLKATLASDAAQREKLAKGEEREENRLVDAEAPSRLAAAYELAKSLESAITESYKDIKATQTAMAKKMSFAVAQKMTDVARPARMQADVKALESKPRTKEDFDRQKQAQADVVREANAMVEATVAMMNAAMESVWADKASQPQLRRAEKPCEIRRLEADDFAARASDEARAARLAFLQSESDYQLQLENAAAESADEKAKDLADLMAQSNAETAREGKLLDASAGPPALKGGDLALLPGNIMNVTTDAKGGIPAKWMYVTSWYVIGPFPNPNRANLRRKFAPESVQDLDATYIGKDGRVLKWEFMQAHNFDTLNPWGGREMNAAEVVPANREEYSIFYAYAEVFMDCDCDRWVAIGSDDRSDVWLNDIPIWGSSNKLKAWTLAEDFRRVHFKKGRNRILARVENGHWNFGWSVCISVEDTQAKF